MHVAAINWDDVKGWTGIVALVVSVAGFWLSFANYRRDRPRLLATSRFSPGWEGLDPTVEVSIVNAGRRPVILRGLGRQGAGEAWSMTFFDSAAGGKRLGEHERCDITLRVGELVEQDPKAEFDIVDLWVEDTLGARHGVKDARRNLALLRGTTARA